MIRYTSSDLEVHRWLNPKMDPDQTFLHLAIIATQQGMQLLKKKPGWSGWWPTNDGRFVLERRKDLKTGKIYT